MDIVCRTCEHFRENGERIFCTKRNVSWGWDMYPASWGCWKQSGGKTMNKKPSKMRDQMKEKTIRELYSTTPVKEIASMLGVKVTAVYQAAYRMGIPKKCNR